MKFLFAAAVMLAITGVGVSQSVAQTGVLLSGGMGSTSPVHHSGCAATGDRRFDQF
jgi:hypothetical protein